jgi:hypothetical protein
MVGERCWLGSVNEYTPHNSLYSMQRIPEQLAFCGAYPDEFNEISPTMKIGLIS